LFPVILNVFIGLYQKNLMPFMDNYKTLLINIRSRKKKRMLTNRGHG